MSKWIPMGNTEQGMSNNEVNIFVRNKVDLELEFRNSIFLVQYSIFIFEE